MNPPVPDNRYLRISMSLGHWSVSTSPYPETGSGAGKGNPTVETLNKIGEVVGLELGCVPRVPRAAREGSAADV
jgi:hypothetical protein